MKRRRPRAAAPRRSAGASRICASVWTASRREPGSGTRPTLLKAHRRVRTADDRRRALAAAATRRDDAQERLGALDGDLAPFRDVLGLPPGVPDEAGVARLLDLLVELGRVKQESRTREEVLAKESERLAREDADLRDLERHLRDALAATGVPQGLPIAEALLAVEAGRRRAETFRRLQDHELPARREAEAAGDPDALAARLHALDAEVARRTAEAGGDAAGADASRTPEEARRAAEESRAVLARAEEERASAERAARGGGSRGRRHGAGRRGGDRDLGRAPRARDALPGRRRARARVARRRRRVRLFAISAAA